MKEIAIILLIVIGVYLYMRTQKTAQAEKEQAAEQAKPTESAAESEMKDITPEQSEPTSTPTVDGVSFEPKEATETEIQQAAEPEPEPEPKVVVEPTVEDKAEPKITVEVEPEVPTEKLNIVAEPEPGNTEEVIVEAPPVVVPAVKAEEAVKSEAVEKTAESGDLDWANPKLVKALADFESANDSATQHLALSAAVAECYKQRKTAEYVEYGAGLSQRYLEVFAAFIKGVKAENPDTDVKGAGMMHLSTLLNDKGEFDSAISICKTAIEYGLTDGTVTDFSGRIVRIEKAKAKANKAG